MNTLKLARENFKEGKHAKAAELYQQAIANNPKESTLYLELSSCLWALGQIDEALVVAKNALQHANSTLAAHIHLQLAKLYLTQGRHPIAADLFYRLIKNNTHATAARLGLSDIYIQEGRPNKALATLLPALTENNPLILQNIAVALFNAKKIDDALQLALEVINMGQANPSIISNGLMLTNYIEGSYEKSIAFKQTISRFFPNNIPYNPPIAPTDRIKIGLISADLYSHPVGWFTASFFPYLDHSKVEFILYDNRPTDDFLAQKIKHPFKKYVPVSLLNDEELLATLREDKLNILIDLSGHTKGNRLSVLSQRAAPIQASYLGYFASTFVPNIDYVITDAIHVPKVDFGYYSEKIIHLPCSRFCYLPPEYASEVNELPAMINKEFTFASFANFSKISQKCIKLWSDVLLAIPNSRLQLRWKSYNDPEIKQALWQDFEQHGISRNRIELYSDTGHEDLFAQYKEVDIALDTTPFSGAATTCEALWMGVPVITLSGETGVARQSASILHTIGLKECVAHSTESFVACALSLTQNIEHLSDLRKNMRDKMCNSTLINGKEFAAHFMQALNDMLEQHKTQSTSNNQSTEASITNPA